MKIVCDACQAKYSISDDKVQGKVFKIRCKKCSNIIVVRGGAGAVEAAPAQEKDTRVYDYGHEAGDQGGGGDESVWHVVINQDQVGPMTAAEVQQRFAAGEIDGETYAWREGFADWLPLSQVDAFAGYVASGSTTAAVGGGGGGGGGAAAVSAMFGGGGGDEAGTMRSDPGDLFAAASSGAAAHGDDDGGDLFGSKPSSSRAQDAANAKLRGERNENSVLFSLNNLAQLASDKPAQGPGVSTIPSGQATGAAGGEGSGLIDIRSMANAYLGGSAGAAKPASSIGSIDDLPVFGGGGFSEPAVIVPTAQRSGNNKMMYALIGSIGVLAVAAVIMIIVLLRGGNNNNNKEDKPQQVAANDKVGAGSDEKKEPGASDTKPSDTKPSDSKPAEGSDSAKPSDTKPADTATKPVDEPKKDPVAEPKKDPVKPKDPKPAHPRDPKPPKEPVAAVNNPKPPKEPVVKPDTGGGGCDEVSCVLNNYEGACCSKFKKGGGRPTGAPPPGGGGAPKSDLPDALDRTMISDGVGKVKARVMACGDKSSAKGQVKVSVKVDPSGHVSSVSVKATPDPGLGSCVAGAMQKASFAKTQGGGSFSYPFVF